MRGWLAYLAKFDRCRDLSSLKRGSGTLLMMRLRQLSSLNVALDVTTFIVDLFGRRGS